MKAWSEVPGAITAVQEMGYETYVFANGTTQLQLDLCASSGLSFDMLFSSEILGIYKPALGAYTKVLHLTKLDASQTVQVAAHADDLRGAKEAGMGTIYIKRWTDDIKEDDDLVISLHCWSSLIPHIASCGANTPILLAPYLVRMFD